MILNIRGTSGSGKSTLAQRLMSYYPEREPIWMIGRRRPFGYICRRPGHPELFVLGHYEMPTGGGDTVSGLDLIYEHVTAHASAGRDVLYEGLIIQSDGRRCGEAAARFPLRVVILDIPIDLCLASVAARRAARGNTKPLNPENTIAKAKSIPGQVKQLLGFGVDVRVVTTREEGERLCLEALALTGLEPADDSGTSEPVFRLRA